MGPLPHGDCRAAPWECLGVRWHLGSGASPLEGGWLVGVLQEREPTCWEGRAGGLEGRSCSGLGFTVGATGGCRRMLAILFLPGGGWAAEGQLGDFRVEGR